MGSFSDGFGEKGWEILSRLDIETAARVVAPDNAYQRMFETIRAENAAAIGATPQEYADMTTSEVESHIPFTGATGPNGEVYVLQRSLRQRAAGFLKGIIFYKSK